MNFYWTDGSFANVDEFCCENSINLISIYLMYSFMIGSAKRVA